MDKFNEEESVDMTVSKEKSVYAGKDETLDPIDT